MRWRNQSKPNNFLSNLNNKTLDSFMNGIQFITKQQSDSPQKVVPKIKVPHSSGLQAGFKPKHSPFLYPLYPQLRQYQYNIALKCVTQNTLVCLPTGLGKTHIASVMIINYHIWFPQGLIFFLAPTKPLVDQQSMSLSNYKHLVSPNAIYSLTGSIQSIKRTQVYKKKKILFCTPQTLQNDLKQYRLIAKNIVLIIFDQAHKGIGNYSYANIIRLLNKQQFGYRIIGLSATPGSDNQRIQQIIQNLQITNMIIKTDDDQDVKKYIKKRKVQPIYIMFSNIIQQIDNILKQFISWPLNQLLKFHLFDRNLASGKYGFNANCFYLINQQINQRISHLPIKYVHIVQQAKGFLKFMADSQSILRQAGYQSFKRKFIYQIDGIQQNDNILAKLMPDKQKIHPNFIKIVKQHQGYKRIKQLMTNTANISSHPKLQKLRSLLYQFFNKPQNIQKKSKVIVFASLRFTCHEIYKYLSQPPYGQTIKSQIFLGQAKTTVQTRDGQNTITETLKLSQKQQINLIKRYKANQLNTLISTSIGQQGLDIGQVDAIFCYQGGMSTIRMIQRMGRTGRKRQGIVYMLLMQGKQSDDYEKAYKKSERMKKLNIKKFKYYSFNPVLFQQHKEIPVQFFNKPQQIPVQQVISQSDSVSTNGNQTDTADTKKSKATKKKKNSKKQQKQTNNNNKKTKKNKAQNIKQNNQKIQQIIQQATKSQQCSQQQQTQNTNTNYSMDKNINNINNIIQKYSKIQTKSTNNQENNKYFKIVGRQTKVPKLEIQQIQNLPKSQQQPQQQQSKQQNSIFSNSHQSQQQYKYNKKQKRQNIIQQIQNCNKFPHQYNSNQMYHTQIQYTQQQLSKYSISQINYMQNQKFKMDKGFKQFDKLFDLDKLLFGDDEEQQQGNGKVSNNEKLQQNKDKQNKGSQNENSKKQQKQICPNFGITQNSNHSNKQIKCDSCEQIQDLQNSLLNQQFEQVKSPQFPKPRQLKQQYINEVLNKQIPISLEQQQQLSQQTKRMLQLTKYMQKKRQQDGNFRYILDQIRKIEQKQEQQRRQIEQRKQQQREYQKMKRERQKKYDLIANKKPIQYHQQPYKYSEFTPKDKQKIKKLLQNVDLDSLQQSKSSSQKNRKLKNRKSYHQLLLKMPQPVQPQKRIQLLKSSQKFKQLLQNTQRQQIQNKNNKQQQQQQYDQLQQLFAQHNQIIREMSQRQQLRLKNSQNNDDNDSDGLQQIFRQHEQLKLKYLQHGKLNINANNDAK